MRRENGRLLPKLRFAICVVAVTSAGGASAQEDAEHVRIFADKYFAIEFPADPVVHSGRYNAVTPAGTKVSVPATLYELRQDGALYQVTVADFANSAAEEPHALDHAVSAYRQGKHDLALDTAISHSLNGSRYQLCGRQFGYAGPAGTLNYQTIYYNPNTHLFYDIFSNVTEAAQPLHGADVEHFQTSFAIQADPKSQVPALPPYPDSWKLYKYPEVGFEIRFPGEPTEERTSYATEAGIKVPATRWSVRQGDALFRVTVATYWGTAADPDGAAVGDPVDGAIRLWQRQGKVLASDAVAISNGQCGRDITLQTADGRQSRALIYFPATQHKLYIVEVSHVGRGTPSDRLDDLRFRASLALATAQ